MFKKKAYNTIWTLCLLLALCFIFAHPAQAAGNDALNADLSMEISYGYDNYQKNGRIMPVWIQITNKGSAFAGELTFKINSDLYEGMSFSQHISVLSKTKEEFVFYVPYLDSYTDITVTLTDTEGNTQISLSEATLNRNTTDLYIGILSSEPDTIKAMIEQMAFVSPVDNTYTGARSVLLSDHILPETKEGYDGIDMIIANHFNADYMNEKQAKALSGWIKDGGILLTGSPRHMDGFFEKLNLTPLSTDTIETVTTDFNADYQSYIYAASPLTYEPLKKNPTKDDINNARLSYYEPTMTDIHQSSFENVGSIVIDMDAVSVSDGNDAVVKPLYQYLELGNGKVIISKFDFCSEPFISFEAAIYVLQNILTENITHAGWSHFFNYAADFRNVWSSQSVLLNTLYEKIPGYGKYVVILFIYIVLIGPVLYFLLKKTDKRYMMWIAVPVLTVIFTIIIFAAGSSTRHTSPFINYASFIDYNYETPKENTFYSMTIPDKEDFSQNIDDDYTVCLMNNNYVNFDSVWENIFSDYVQSININSGMTYTNLPEGGTNISINNTVLFSTRYFNLQNDDADIDAIMENITFENGHYTGTIENHSDYFIENACIMISGRLYGIGNISPHSNISVDIEAVSSRNTDEDIENEVLHALGISSDRRHEGESIIKTNMFIQFINANYANTYPFVLGFIPDYKPSVFDESSIPATGITMFHKKADINYTDSSESIHIPDISQLMSVNSGEIYNLSMDLYSAETEMMYNFSNDFVPESLKLVSVSDNLDIFAYNYTTDCYEPIFKNTDTFKEDIQNYFDENKILQLKFVQKVPGSNEDYILPVISAAGKVK